jgi:uncharacterized protein
MDRNIVQNIDIKLRKDYNSDRRLSVMVRALRSTILEENTMRVIVLGGTGLIGKALVAGLVKDGYAVVVLSRDPRRYSGRLPAGVQLQGWDGRSAQGWSHLADGAAALVNLAGESIGSGRWTAARKKSILESRVNAGKAVVEAVDAAQDKPRVVIQASAVGYYGSRRDEIVTEQDGPGDDFQSGVCQAWEASTLAVEAAGVRRAVIRSGVVLSLKGGAFPLMLLPFRLFVGGKTGSGAQWLSWIHLADEIAAIRFLIKNPQASGVFNLSAPNPLTNAALSRLIGEVMHRPALLPAPAFAVRAVLGEMSTLILDGQRVVPERLQALDFIFQYPQAEGALRALLR